jgi:hypothetical protein
MPRSSRRSDEEPLLSDRHEADCECRDCMTVSGYREIEDHTDVPKHKKRKWIRRQLTKCRVKLRSFVRK